jgi:tellurite resistance protein
MILGLGGLANGWRTASRIWQAPALVGDILAVTTALIWAILLVLYVGKWFWARDDALAEARHPVQGFFLALLPVSSMIVSIVLAPMLPIVAWGICMAGVVGQVVFSAYGMGGIWQGDRAQEDPARDDRAAGQRQAAACPSDGTSLRRHARPIIHSPACRSPRQVRIT